MMRISLIILFYIKSIYSIKYGTSSSIFGFINYGANNSLFNKKYNTSIHKYNKNRKYSLNSLDSQTDHSSVPLTLGDYSHLDPSNFKLRGIKLENSISPLSDYVLVVRSDVSDVTSSGVYLGAQKSRDFIGTVLAVGPGRLNKKTGVVTPLSVYVGDTVLFDAPEDTLDLKFKNKPCLLVREEQIFARIRQAQDNLDSVITHDKVIPLFDRMLVRVMESPKRTESGLVISRSDGKNDLIKAKVISMGPGSYTEDGKLVPIEGVTVGDVILYQHNEFDSGEFTSNNNNYAFVRRDSVLGKL